ncbi:hypothetical protein V6D40_03245 [Corynebacterium sp. Q4381]|uniref:hypothetical protein n=1 Tax=Corynebacterium sp. Marseille-Q4381 TaxID=3121597 RepID=UPI002FE53C4A
MRTRVSQTPKRVAAAALAAAALTAIAPVSAAQAEVAEVAEVAEEKVITTFASGAVGDTFECGGIIGRLWCK